MAGLKIVFLWGIRTFCETYKHSSSLDYYFMVHCTLKKATCVFHTKLRWVGEAQRRGMGSHQPQNVIR